ncbi:MAG: hypothetical protein KDA91_14280 [Planctomycetaceae bacterium]|nr:hypothetical protein [Planctomycetaceae bacterium]
MAVTIKASPILIGSSYSWSKGVYKATYDWQLEVAFPPQNWIEVLPEVVVSAYIGQLPVEGSLHPFVWLAYCDGTKCEHLEGGFYKFSATYTNEHSDASKGEPGKDTNPLNDLPVVEPIAGIRSIPIYKDIEDNALLNAAGDPLIDEAERQTIGYTISVNLAQLPTYINELVDSKSGAPIIVEKYNHLIPAEQARFVLPSDFISTQRSRNGTDYFAFKYELRIDYRDDHDGKLLNAGFNELYDDDGTTRKRPIKFSGNGGEPSEPVPLDPATGAVLDNPAPDTVDYITSKRYAPKDYSILPGVKPG